MIGPARFRQRSGIQFVHPQVSVNRGSFPRIFGLPVHAYLVYIHGFSTHIWSTFTHKWSTYRPHLTDYDMDALSPVYLYENPIWIACSRRPHCGNRRGQRTADRQEPPPPRGERRLRRLAGEPGNVRRRGKKQHPVILDLKTQRGVHTANAPEGIEDLCAELGAALRSFGIPGAEAPA